MAYSTICIISSFIVLHLMGFALGSHLSDRGAGYKTSCQHKEFIIWPTGS
jgi:hypothetical protein